MSTLLTPQRRSEIHDVLRAARETQEHLSEMAIGIEDQLPRLAGAKHDLERLVQDIYSQIADLAAYERSTTKLLTETRAAEGVVIVDQLRSMDRFRVSDPSEFEGFVFEAGDTVDEDGLYCYLVSGGSYPTHVPGDEHVFALDTAVERVKKPGTT